MAATREPSSAILQRKAVPKNGTPDSGAPEAGMTITAFLKKVKRNKLLQPTIFDRLQFGVKDRMEEDCLAFAEMLVDAGHLTQWQVERILKGKSGFTLGRYKLVDRIAAGGMGVVLKGWQPNQKRMVAIKVLSRTLIQKADAVRRFEQEIAAAAALNHPHIVQALNADCVQGVPYLVMEYVEGKTLNDLVVARGPLPVEWACEFCRQAAEGLEHARERDIVHRDIKPSNLLLTRRSPQDPPIVKILDFGLARFTSENPASTQDTNLTAQNQVFGTVDFISPEQARSARSADIRADIFSLGCTLFYLLTAQVPFEGETAMEKLSARLAEDAPSIRTIRPDISPELEHVIARMLCRDRDERFQTPREVAQALAFLASGTDRRKLSSSSVSIVFRKPQEIQRAETETSMIAESEDGLERFLGQLEEDTLSNSSQEHPVYKGESNSSVYNAIRQPGRKTPDWMTYAVLAAVTTVFTLLALFLFRSDSGPEPQPQEREEVTYQSTWPGTDPALYTWRAEPGTFAATNDAVPEPYGDAAIDPLTGIMELSGGQIAIPGAESKVLAGMKTTNEFYLELVFSTGNLQQVGPARIVTFSSGSDSRNFTLGQDGNILNLRLRTKYTGENGLDPSTDLCRIRSNREYHLLVTYRAGELVCYLDGRQVKKSKYVQGDFRNWEPQHLLIGNEWKDNRSWTGKVERLALGNQFLTHKQASEHYRLVNEDRLQSQR